MSPQDISEGSAFKGFQRLTHHVFGGFWMSTEKTETPGHFGRTDIIDGPTLFVGERKLNNSMVVNFYGEGEQKMKDEHVFVVYPKTNIAPEKLPSQ